MTMDYKQIFDLTDKVALVTGAAGILGKAFCRGLLEFGATVIALDIDQAALEGLQQALQNQKLIIHQCDVSSRQSIEEAVAFAVKQYSRIDILLNNAASKSSDLAAFFADDIDYDLKTWREVMSVNLDGAFLMAQAVGKHMLKQQCGTIVQTASIYGVVAADQRIYEGSHYLGQTISNPAVYAASKAGIVGLTRHLAARWATHGVRVNAISPGGVGSGQNNTFAQKYSARVPMGRMATPDDMVGAMLYLVSDAAAYVTGQNIVVDGGLSVW